MHRCSGIHHEFALLCPLRRGCRHYPCFGKGVERSLVLYFELVDISRQVRCFSAGASFFVAKLPFVCNPRILAHTDCVTWGSHFWILPCDGPFPSRFLMWCHVPLEHLTVWFDPDFPTSRRINFLGGQSWDTQPNSVDSFSKAIDPFPPLFFDFFWLPIRLSVSEETLVAEFASWHRQVLLTYRRMPKITRRICALSFEKFCARFLAFYSKRILSPLCQNLSKDFLLSVCAFGAGEHDCAFLSTITSVAETTRVSSWTLSNCFPLMAFSHFSFRADVSSFSTLDQCSPSQIFHYAASEIAHPNRPINVSAYHDFQSLTAWQGWISIKFLGLHGQFRLKLNRISYFHHVQTFQDISLGISLTWE